MGEGGGRRGQRGGARRPHNAHLERACVTGYRDGHERPAVFVWRRLGVVMPAGEKRDTQEEEADPRATLVRLQLCSNSF